MGSILNETSSPCEIINICDLPKGILLDVFAYLPKRSLTAAASTCRLFYEVTCSRITQLRFNLILYGGVNIESHHIWNEAAVYPNVIQKNHRWHPKNREADVEKQRAFFTQKGQYIKSLEIDSPSNCKFIDKVPNVRHLKFFNCDCGEIFNGTEQLQLLSLQTLIIERSTNTLEALKIICSLDTPRLTKFVIEICQTFSDDQSNLMLHFIRKNADQLLYLELKLRHDNYFNIHTIPTLQLLGLELYVYDRSEESFLKILQHQKQLKYLKLSYFSEHDIMRSIIPAIYNHQTKLREFSLMRLGGLGEYRDKWERMIDLIHRFPLLESLNLTYQSTKLIFEVINMINMPHENLRKLSLKYSSEIIVNKDFIKNISICFPKLNSLEIHNTNYELINDIFDYLINLKELKLQQRSAQSLNFFQRISTLRNLESLTFFRPSKLFLHDEFTQNFSFGKLRNLTIECEINEMGFRNIIRNCRKIEKLTSLSNCFILTMELIEFISMHLANLETFHFVHDMGRGTTTTTEEVDKNIAEYMRNTCRNLQKVVIKYCSTINYI